MRDADLIHASFCGDSCRHFSFPTTMWRPKGNKLLWGEGWGRIFSLACWAEPIFAFSSLYLWTDLMLFSAEISWNCYFYFGLKILIKNTHSIAKFSFSKRRLIFKTLLGGDVFKSVCGIFKLWRVPVCYLCYDWSEEYMRLFLGVSFPALEGENVSWSNFNYH